MDTSFLQPGCAFSLGYSRFRQDLGSSQPRIQGMFGILGICSTWGCRDPIPDPTFGRFHGKTAPFHSHGSECATLGRVGTGTGNSGDKAPAGWDRGGAGSPLPTLKSQNSQLSGLESAGSRWFLPSQTPQGSLGNLLPYGAAGSSRIIPDHPGPSRDLLGSDQDPQDPKDPIPFLWNSLGVVWARRGPFPNFGVSRERRLPFPRIPFQPIPTPAAPKES